MSQQHVVVYTRVSSKEQALGFSIAAQASLIREYCAKKELRIIAEFSDDESAKTGGTRTEFRQMVEFIKKHPDCRTVVVEKLDRAYRNLADYLTLDQLDLELHLVKDGEVMSKTSTSSQRLMRGIRVLFARSVSENIAEESIEGDAPESGRRWMAELRAARLQERRRQVRHRARRNSIDRA